MLLITGANGQLGQCFQQAAAKRPEQRFRFLGSGDLDISDRSDVRRFFEGLRAENERVWVVNCAAYTAVDRAENDQLAAKKINVLGTKHLAEACAAQGYPLIHFSSDYVYHNRQNTPLRESDPLRPQGVYAHSKLQGERAALRVHPSGTTVIRTSWVYAPFGHNFLKTMLRLGRERQRIQVVCDQIGTPTYAPDLAEAVLSIIQQVETGRVDQATLAGVWNYSNEGVASWYDFAVAIFDMANIPCQVQPIASSAYPTPARRPPFSVLDKSKIKAAFGLDIPHWRESLRRCLLELGQGQ